METLFRGLITFFIWLAFIIIIAVVAGVLSLTGSPVPSLLFLAAIVLAGISTLAIWNEQIWETIKREILGNIQQQLGEQFSELKPEELEEVRKGMAELKRAVGIDIQLPREKRKRDQIDTAIRNLSDSQLLELRQGLNDGTIEEDDLLDWLSEQEENLP